MVLVSSMFLPFSAFAQTDMGATGSVTASGFESSSETITGLMTLPEERIESFTFERVHNSKVTGISNLLAYYDFEQTGTTLTDQASNLGDGTSNGGVTTGVTGKVGNAWSFDGSNDHASTPLVETLLTSVAVSA